MDFRQLETFAATVEHRSFSAAGESLYLAQPTVSAHIHALEKELHVRLIHRTSKQFEVTPEGQRLYQYAKSILQLQHKAVHELDRTKTRTLHIGASSIPGQYILPELLARYHEKEKEILFEVSLDDSTEIVERLERGTLDLGLVGTRTHARCVFHPVAADELVIATPNTPYYRKLQKEGWSMEALLRSPFLMRSGHSGTAVEWERFLAEQGVSGGDLQVVAHINDAEALLGCVMQGLGISVVSRRMAQPQAEQGKLLVCPLKQRKLVRQLYLIYPADDCLPDGVKDFIAFAEKELMD